MRYFPRVKRFISGLLQDDITAEDFAQDILLKLWQKREEMAKIENLNAYLYRTSRNAVYQHLRHILLVNEYGEKNNCGNTANKIGNRCCGNYAVGRN